MGAFSADVNYTFSADVSYIIIKPMTDTEDNDLELRFKSEFGNRWHIIDTDHVEDFAFGGDLYVNGEVRESDKMHALYVGTTLEGEFINQTDPVKVPGIYTETIYNIGGNYLPVPIIRAYIVTIPRYTVNWLNDDGEVLTSTQVTYGEVPEIPFDTVDKDDDSRYSYEFIGWTPEIVAAYSDAEYTAVFKPHLIPLDITITNNTIYADGKRYRLYSLVLTTDGDYYYVNDAYKMAMNQKIYLNESALKGTDLKPAYYYFGADGKMVNANGPMSDGYFYLNNERQNAYQLILFEGNYYFIGDSHKIIKNGHLYLGAAYLAGTDFVPGYYDFDADGKMIIKNGLQPDGTYYVNGKRSDLLYRFIEIDGDYYFIYDGYKIAKNTRLYISGAFLNGTDFEAGYFNFDADGKLYIPETPAEGTGDDGYFYLGGVKQIRYQLIKYGDDYYFINDNDKYAKNTRLYLSAAYVAGSDLSAGYYRFDAQGRIIIEPTPDGANEDGFFYLNGIKQTRYKLIELDGKYYFINDGDKYAKNTRLYLSEGFVKGSDLAAGYYRFGADGAIVF